MQFLFGLSDGGAIRNHRNEMGQDAIVVLDRDDLHHDGNRIARHVAGFDFAVPVAACAQRMEQFLIKGGREGLWHDHIGRAADNVHRVCACNLAIGTVGAGDVQVRVKYQNTILGGFKYCHRLTELVIGQTLIGNVLHHAYDALGALAVIDIGLAACAEPALGAFALLAAENDVIEFAMQNGIFECLADHVAITGCNTMQKIFPAFGDCFCTLIFVG